MGTVYGASAVLDDTRTHLVTLMTDLQSAMVIDETNPLIGAVYTQHAEVIKVFNAVSIDLETYTSVPMGLDLGIITDYSMIWSIRIHTDYQDGSINTTKVTQLMDSVKGYLNTHKVFVQSENYRIDVVNGGSNRDTFDESFTVGGSILVTVIKRVSHEQA